MQILLPNQEKEIVRILSPNLVTIIMKLPNGEKTITFTEKGGLMHYKGHWRKSKQMTIEFKRILLIS